MRIAATPQFAAHPLQVQRDFKHSGAIAGQWRENIVEHVVQRQRRHFDAVMVRLDAEIGMGPRIEDPVDRIEHDDGGTRIVDAGGQRAAADLGQHDHPEARVFVELAQWSNGKCLGDQVRFDRAGVLPIGQHVPDGTRADDQRARRDGQGDAQLALGGDALQGIHVHPLQIATRLAVKGQAGWWAEGHHAAHARHPGAARHRFGGRPFDPGNHGAQAAQTRDAVDPAHEHEHDDHQREQGQHEQREATRLAEIVVGRRAQADDGENEGANKDRQRVLRDVVGNHERKRALGGRLPGRRIRGHHRGNGKRRDAQHAGGDHLEQVDDRALRDFRHLPVDRDAVDQVRQRHAGNG